MQPPLQLGRAEPSLQCAVGRAGGSDVEFGMYWLRLAVSSVPGPRPDALLRKTGAVLDHEPRNIDALE
jgi:hypothetical protein